MDAVPSGPHIAVDQSRPDEDHRGHPVLDLPLRQVLLRRALAQRAHAVVLGHRARDVADFRQVLDDAVAVGAAADVARQRHDLVAHGLHALVHEAGDVGHVLLDDPGGLFGALHQVLLAGGGHARDLAGEELLGGFGVAEDDVLFHLLGVGFLVGFVLAVDEAAVGADAAVVLAAGGGGFDVVAACGGGFFL